MIGSSVLAAAVMLGAFVVFLLLRRRFVLVTVRGSSMEPTLFDGDRVLVRRRHATSVRRGEVIVLANPDSERALADPRSLDRDWLIKRVVALPGDPVPRAGFPALALMPEHAVPADKLVVLGDNPAHSHDSRAVGYLATALLLGVVIRPVDEARRRPLRRS